MCRPAPLSLAVRSGRPARTALSFNTLGLLPSRCDVGLKLGDFLLPQFVMLGQRRWAAENLVTTLFLGGPQTFELLFGAELGRLFTGICCLHPLTANLVDCHQQNGQQQD